MHAACHGKQSFSVINFLLQQYPDAIKEKSKDGDLPLHAACRYELSLEVIVLLVKQYPDAVTEKSKDGDLPVHLACQSYQSLEVIKFLVRHHPDTVKEKDNDGRTPFDLARDTEDYRTPDYQIVKWLMAFESAQINFAKLPPVPPRSARETPVEIAINGESLLDDTQGSRELPLDSHAVGVEPDETRAASGDKLAAQREFVLEQSSASVEALVQYAGTGTGNIGLGEPATAAVNDVTAEDCCSVQNILEESENAVFSSSSIESSRTDEIIGNGFFGTACNGTDTKTHRSLLIKAISTDIPKGGHSADDQKAKEAIRMEIVVRYTLISLLLTVPARMNVLQR